MWDLLLPLCTYKSTGLSTHSWAPTQYNNTEWTIWRVRLRVVVNGIISHWWLVTSGVPRDQFYGQLLSVFVKDLDAGVEPTLSRFAGDTKLAGAIRFREDREALRRSLDRFECWTITNHIKFYKSKWQIMHLWQCHPGCLNGLGHKWLKCNPAE